jgi:hypothetical protein
MWTAQRSKIQRLISQQLQLQRQQRELASLPNLPPAHAAAVHNPLSPDDFAIRQQGLINCLCPTHPAPTSRLLSTTLVPQTVLPSLDVLPRLATLPKLPHMPATIAASLLLSRNIWFHSSHS